MDPSSRPLGACGILRESIKILAKNCKLTIPLILLVLIPYSLLFTADFYISISSLDYLSLSKPRLFFLHSKFSTSAALSKSTSVLKDERVYDAVEELILPVANYVVLLFTMMGTIYLSSAALAGERLGVGGLFCRIGRRWRGPVFTQIYVTILTTGFMQFVNNFVGILSTIAEGALGLMAVGVLLVIFAYFLYIFLDVVWTTGLAVSVVESRSGLGALGSAEELIRGRRIQGFAISFLFVVVSLVITAAPDFVTEAVPQTDAAQLAIRLVMANLGWLLDIFKLAAFTVFYYDCRKRRGVVGDGVEGYSPLPASPPIDGALA